MGMKDEVAEIIRPKIDVQLLSFYPKVPNELADKILQLMVLEGVEKYRECLECEGKGHQHCVAMSGIPYVAPCDHCETGEIVEPIRFDEVEFYFLGEEDIDDKQTWWLKPHLSMWKVRSVKP